MANILTSFGYRVLSHSLTLADEHLFFKEYET